MKIEGEVFLREMLAEGLFNTEQFNLRLHSVLQQIETGAVQTKVWENKMQEDGEIEEVKVDGISGSGWVQTKEELQRGVQVAWRNSRKCIMRAHFGELKMVDLRYVKTSRGMLDAVIEHLPAAYNDGKIVPTGK
jgi:nitric oxide synthase oxygenase domain/subunit